MRESLHYLFEHFYKLAVPSQGRYVNEAAITDETGVVYTPHNNFNYRSLAIKVLGATALTAMACALLIRKNKKVNKNKAALAYEVW
ncbi:MAG: hypothetical protein ABJA71_05000 [Ginsengibacter sp.]